MIDFKADIAVLLNITPDHLDRYHYKLQNYIDAKFRILQNQTCNDAFILWNDDPIITRELEKHNPKAALYPFSEVKHANTKGWERFKLSHDNRERNCGLDETRQFESKIDNDQMHPKGYTENGQLIVNTPNGVFSMPQDRLTLKGVHNLNNSLAAAIASKLLDIQNEQIRESLADFAGVAHRLERVARIDEVDYINDSKATNVNSCRYALQSIDTRIVLILGGIYKGNDYMEIESLVLEKVHALIFLGLDNEKLYAFFSPKISVIEDASSMEEAVKKAALFAQKGDTVLLSPCCASFDLFKNYEDRGNQFKKSVYKL
jgi:UDP-N-acetylmuramoylalanine--D-glutamate ligase